MVTAGYMCDNTQLRPEWVNCRVYADSSGTIAPLDAPSVFAAGSMERVQFFSGQVHTLPTCARR